MVAAAIWLHFHYQLRHRDGRIADLKGDIKTLTAERYTLPENPFRTIGDRGPIPFRPNHPKRLGGKYYRGNDERHADLFNGGVYQTAMFRIFLCDLEKKELQWDMDFTGKKLFIAVEINRSPKAHVGLFDPRIMRTVFLSQMVSNIAEGSSQKLNDDFVFFEEIKVDRQWIAYYPVTLESDGSASGLIYMYVGRASSKAFNAVYHYGINFEIKTNGNKIGNASEIWMGSLYHPLKIQFPEKGKLPLNEWFDYRPIPEIDKENSSDPKLLGVDKQDGAVDKKNE